MDSASESGFSRPLYSAVAVTPRLIPAEVEFYIPGPRNDSPCPPATHLGARSVIMAPLFPSEVSQCPEFGRITRFLVSFQVSAFCRPESKRHPSSPLARGSRPPRPAVEDVYHGELVSFPGPWSFQIGKSWAVMVSDEQLEQLADPDKKVKSECRADTERDVTPADL